VKENVGCVGGAVESKADPEVGCPNPADEAKLNVGCAGAEDVDVVNVKLFPDGVGRTRVEPGAEAKLNPVAGCAGAVVVPNAAFGGARPEEKLKVAAEGGNIGEIRTGVACGFEVPPNRFGVGLLEEVPARTPNLLRKSPLTGLGAVDADDVCWVRELDPPPDRRSNGGGTAGDLGSTLSGSKSSRLK